MSEALRLVRDAPVEGYHYEAVEDAVWRVTDASMRCRFTVGPAHKVCGRRTVAALLRGNGSRRVWWYYCADHLYGRWLENGRIMSWRLVKDAP